MPYWLFADQAPIQIKINGQIYYKCFLWQGLRMLREEKPSAACTYTNPVAIHRWHVWEREAENKGYYYHADQIFTPLEMTDADGHIVW